ncbi:hypothetical protein [uncultured Roseicyclus sp.]|jgi:hypothetical protein|uniref:hypothetical protein n=1 Tax=uncultured Roseicyclus sp. TaxID=543072 RepID=UPI0026293E98|nr:hypothetical protein [uncultured Roseicyclus sp.]
MARRLGMIAVVALAVGLGGFGLIRLAGAGATEFRLEGAVLHVAGPLNGAAADRMQRLFEEHPGLEVVALGDLPGADDVVWAAGMGRLIRAAGLETRAVGPVVNDAILLYLGGVRRVVEGGALVLHSDAVQRQRGIAVDASVAAQADRQQFVAAMLGDGRFADFMAATRAARESYQLTAEDMARFGLQTQAQ